MRRKAKSLQARPYPDTDRGEAAARQRENEETWKISSGNSPECQPGWWYKYLKFGHPQLRNSIFDFEGGTFPNLVMRIALWISF